MLLKPFSDGSTRIAGTWTCNQPSGVTPIVGNSGQVIGQYGETTEGHVALVVLNSYPAQPGFKMDFYAAFSGNSLNGEMNVSGVTGDDLILSGSRN
jgi:hypothetical protein